MVAACNAGKGSQGSASLVGKIFVVQFLTKITNIPPPHGNYQLYGNYSLYLISVNIKANNLIVYKSHTRGGGLYFIHL